MRVAFRLDASRRIGAGHFYRCLVLADQLRMRGARVTFLSQELPSALAAIAEGRGHSVLYLGCAAMDNAADIDELLDARQSLHSLSSACDWVILDHYSLGLAWERALRASARHVMVIDDLADREHDCDLLLDQNYYANMASRYIGKVPRACKLLLGPAYALLRSEFESYAARYLPRERSVNRILVSFGASDAENRTSSVIRVLARNFEKITADVVIGAMHPSRSMIESQCREHGYSCHIQTDDMALLMYRADIAIGAGGSTTWERCLLGLPTVAIVTAENQRRCMKDLADAGVVVNLGAWEDDIAEQLNLKLRLLIENSALRQELSAKSRQIMRSWSPRVVADAISGRA